MKVFLVLFLISCLGGTLINSIELKCNFEKNKLEILGNVYSCDYVDYKTLINETTDRTIDKLTGSHKIESIGDENILYSDHDVKVVNMKYFEVRYFPLDLHKYFINLEGILIRFADLMLITKEDLAAFQNLRLLNLSKNKIQVLEPGLFENNQMLEMIDLSRNNIAYIHPYVFNDFVDRMSILNLSKNPKCTFYYADNKEKVNQVISRIQDRVCADEQANSEHMKWKEIFMTTTTTPRIKTTTTTRWTTKTTEKITRPSTTTTKKTTTSTTPVPTTTSTTPVPTTTSTTPVPTTTSTTPVPTTTSPITTTTPEITTKLHVTISKLERQISDLNSKIKSLTENLDNQREVSEDLEIILMRKLENVKTEMQKKLTEQENLTTKLEKEIEDLKNKPACECNPIKPTPGQAGCECKNIQGVETKINNLIHSLRKGYVSINLDGTIDNYSDVRNN